jgi:hypothetical protein
MAGKRNGRAFGWNGWLRRILARASDGELAAALRRLDELELKMRESEEWRNAPPIVIEHVRIDKVTVEKIEHNNNFAALGIKELGGRLNIGANYTLSEDKLPPEAAEGLEALYQAEAAVRRTSHPAGDKMAGGGTGGNGTAGSGTVGARRDEAAAGPGGAGPKVGIRGQPSSIPR